MNVLVVLGHPRTDSYCGALAEAYREGADEAGVDVRELAVADCEFDPDVHAESPAEQSLEPDLRDAQRDIEWADHLVFVYPNWWATMPARLKGFFDRVFEPGFAFADYDEGEGAGHAELLDDKTAELIVTMDMPPWVYRWLYRRPGTNAIERGTLGYAGVRTTRVTELGPIEGSSLEEREGWLEDVRGLGRSLESGPESTRQRAMRKATTWLGALRLQFHPMAWIAYTIGALAAVGSTAVFQSSAYWFGLGFLFFLEAATVFANEYYDYETDRENTFAGPFTGGSQVLVDDRLSFGELRVGIGVTAALSALFGLSTLVAADGSTVALGGAMAALAIPALGYTVPPLQLSYRTLGEVTVAWTHSIAVLLIGFVAVGGSWRTPEPWLLGLPYALSILPAITLAGVPDVAADRAAGKRTIAARFGVDGAARFAIVATVLAAVTGLAWIAFDVVPAAYGSVIALSTVHALGLCWLLHRRLTDATGAQQITTLLIASLSYLTWFAVVPLLELLEVL
ncbi:NAD(P)H-dependent oxidoreductase [Natronolimnohabitans innermongolicus]|uniref:NAD(P)H dehydrogenase (Quinone) n=1 Tax=Natronolimnohabitans innermongolicus JCM 12255 TaxID=1227499 RepID=L9X2D6_9EURY|nr:NAD(P)H-dependent oxidoreductase [Natronolimnohabitans innermongolicus]ELY55885.1 NAD(P)H dehydrogenase (quinone) [Natronolimnohabitans innermongolicus JCM 12255]